MHDRMADLDELALQCQDKKAGTYLREAIACYHAGAMRAAIVSTWIAVAFDFIDKVNILSTQGDAMAKQFAEEFRKIREKSDLQGSLAFERQILDRAHNDLQLISDLEYADLTRLYEDRHRCAHPSMISDDELYQPTAEQVRYLVRSAVSSMLSQPSTSGKAALKFLEEQVRGEYFPTQKEKARTQLEAGPLRKPRPALVRNLAIILLKIITDPADDAATRTRAAAALNALREMHPTEPNAVMTQKFTDRLRPASLKDEHLLIGLSAVARIEDSEAYLSTDVRERLLNFVSRIPDEKFYLVTPSALRISFIRQVAITRVSGLLSRDLSKAVRVAPQLGSESIVRQHAIELYEAAMSWDEANLIGQAVIIPFAHAFERQEVERIVHLCFNNGEVRSSHSFDRVLTALKTNPTVDRSWWDPLLDNRDHDDLPSSLFLNAPAQQPAEEPESSDGEDDLS